MDKRTILAIVISIGIFIVFILFQMAFVKKPDVPAIPQDKTQEYEKVRDDKDDEKADLSNIMPVGDTVSIEQEIIIEESNYKVTFSTKGGVITSLKLNDYKDLDKTPIEMVVTQDSGIYPFILSFGEYSTANDIFSYSSDESSNEYKFSREYKIIENSGEIFFTLVKIYRFNDPYIVDLEVTLESVDREYLPLNFNDVMYTLTFGPQIGPAMEVSDYRKEFPKYLYYANKSRKDVTGNVKNKKQFVIEKDIDWLAIEGKYFVVIIDPPSDFIENHIGFDITTVPGLSSRSSMFFKRPYEKRVAITEKFKCYIGPKISDILDDYSSNDFQKVISGFPVIDQIVWLLRHLLNFLYTLVRNWGVAIILMTIIIKVIFFPLTQKGFKSTAKMQALNPKIEEIKAKYKDNPQKMQAEIGALYKANNINPLSGCLPWLIQIPIFIGLFTMLRGQFDLRGAVFISGWINDLSSPENLLQLPFPIPLVNWTHLNLLPIIMTVMMIVQQKFTQSPNTSGTNQMKLLLYAMPAVFFFICYNMPSGLVLYWTVQNLISLFQQILINKVQKQKKDDIPQNMDENRIKKKK